MWSRVEVIGMIDGRSKRYAIIKSWTYLVVSDSLLPPSI